jgi:hypothetical protein
MIEVSKGVFVGNQQDAEYGWRKNDDWAFVHCAKMPWHKQFVGYIGNGCPKDSPEYLYAVRENAIALNQIDVDNPDFFSTEMIQAAIGFACTWSHRNLLFSCNQGESRSPSMAMLYLAISELIPNSTFKEAETAFKKLYPPYNPKDGIRIHLQQNWGNYIV